MRLFQDRLAQLRQWNRARRQRRGEARFRPSEVGGRKTLAVMGIVKNESLNIVEWLDHYLWQGADHIFVIDNGSTDNTVELITEYAKSHPVTLFERAKKYDQTGHYAEVSATAKIPQRFRWLLVADADEFWFCKDATPVSEALAEFENYDVIYANWSVFGCVPGAPHPESLRTGLTLRAPKLDGNDQTKWIVRTDALTRGASMGIHKIKGADSARTVSDNQRFQVNHYVTQSTKFWTEIKMARGAADTVLHRDVRDMQMFDRWNEMATLEDTALRDMLRQASSRKS